MRHVAKQNATAGSTLDGQIVALITGGFTIQIVSGCGTDTSKLHIYTNASTTMSGPAPAVKRYAEITPASGTCRTSLTAAAVTISMTIPTNSTPVPSTPAPSPTSSPTIAPPTPAPSGSPIPLQTSKVTHVSTIASLFTGGFLLNPTGSAGYMHVYTSSSTSYTTGAPSVGLYVQATGTGPNTGFTGSYVTLYTSAPSSVTVSGAVVAATPYGFTLNAGSSYPAVPIVMNGLTVVAGAQLTAGSVVKVTGMGDAGAAVVAQQVVVSAPVTAATPTPAPIAQKHVLTGDYLGAPYGTTAVAWSAAAPYLNWAQVNSQNATAISAAGIKTQAYSDPNTTSNAGDNLFTSDESTFAHDCSGNRISYPYDNVTMYQMNVGSASMQTLFANSVAHTQALGHFDAVFEDNAGPLVGQNVLPCNYSDAQWLQYGLALNQVSPAPVIFNGLSNLNGHDVSLSLGLLSSSNTMGGNFEHCYSDTATPKMGGWLWQATENTEIDVAARNKLFECMLRNATAASSSTDARTYALASFLLTYNPATSILWEEFATPSGLHVEPESQLVLLEPKVAAPASVASLQQTGGTYGREYGQCFYAGKFVGPCAVVVNPDVASSHPFPYPQYTHTLVLSGGGILDGGTVSMTGGPPPVSLPASEAAIVFP
ncbi:MAG TPA: putative glycoside hydrolase [Candidatus Baltobacteraceae bacterium]|jgi:hypothetical protein